jgi:hypothetical protein
MACASAVSRFTLAGQGVRLFVCVNGLTQPDRRRAFMVSLRADKIDRGRLEERALQILASSSCGCASPASATVYTLQIDRCRPYLRAMACYEQP